MNKKLIAVLGIAVLAVSVSSCASNSSKAAPTVTVTEEAPIDNGLSINASKEDKFLLAVAGASHGNWVLDNSTDEAMLNAGWATCDVFDSGYSLSDVIMTLAGNNPSEDEAYAYGVIIGAAATTLCPEYAYKVSSGA